MFKITKLCLLLFLIFIISCTTTQEESPLEEKPDEKEVIESPSWIMLLAQGFRQAIQIEFHQEVTIEMQELNIESLQLNSSQETKALFLQCKVKGNPRSDISFAVLPWQNLYRTIDIGLQSAPFPAELFTISSYALIFGPIYSQEINKPAQQKIEKITEVMKHVCNYNENQRELNTYLDSPVPWNFQAMSTKVYKYYVDFNVALPGSIIPEDEILLSLAPGKMIVLHIVPDYGPIRVCWLAPPEKSQERFPAINKKNDEKIRLFFNTTLKEAQELAEDEIGRRRLFLRTKEELYNIMKENSFYTDELYSYFEKELLHLLYLPEWILNHEETLEIFPDYEPKMTPDTIYDYRGSMASKLLEIPEAKPENLVELLNLLDKYKARALKNPGYFEEGAIFLGADPRQYVPSDEELMESEIGERIGLIAFKTNPQEMKTILQRAGIIITQVEYKKIEFRHVDVMGSGRFFYASEPFSVTIKLR